MDDAHGLFISNLRIGSLKDHPGDVLVCRWTDLFCLALKELKDRHKNNMKCIKRRCDFLNLEMNRFQSCATEILHQLKRIQFCNQAIVDVMSSGRPTTTALERIARQYNIESFELKDTTKEDGSEEMVSISKSQLRAYKIIEQAIRNAL